MTTKNTIPAPTNTTITQCPNCNGDLSFNPAAQTLDCAFCNSSYMLSGEAVKTEAAITEMPQLIIPFTFAKEAFDKAAIEWISQGDFTPANVLDSYHTGNTKGIYVSLTIWDIDFVIVDPMGNKKYHTYDITAPHAVKNWSAPFIDFAKNTARLQKNTKPFDKIYTLGFEMLDDETLDADNFSDSAMARATEVVVRDKQLSNANTITITNISLTRVYAPFWQNKFTWQDQPCEVAMCGFDVSQIDGIRPVDSAAMKETGPSFKYPLLLILAGVVAICLLGNIEKSLPKIIDDAVSFIIAITTFIVAPVWLVITIIRKASWEGPRGRLAVLRKQKLDQRLAQHKL